MAGDENILDQRSIIEVSQRGTLPPKRGNPSKTRPPKSRPPKVDPSKSRPPKSRPLEEYILKTPKLFEIGPVVAELWSLEMEGKSALNRPFWHFGTVSLYPC